MTYRERREARAERLRGWAEKRQEKAESEYDTARERASRIPFGQPILVGHHSEGADRRYRARIASGMNRAAEHAEKAHSMASRAANIEDQLAGSVYDDDPDVIEALQARIAVAEATRDRIKAYNASCRKGTPNADLLDEKQRRDLALMVRVGGLRANGSFPSYATSNISGRISRDRQRLARLQANTHAGGSDG